LNFHLRCAFCKLQPCLLKICGSISGVIFTRFKPIMCTTNLNEKPGIRLFWTTLQLIATFGISQVLEYSIRSSTKCSIRTALLAPTRRTRAASIISVSNERMWLCFHAWRRLIDEQPTNDRNEKRGQMWRQKSTISRSLAPRF